MTRSYYPRDVLPRGFRVARAENELLIGPAGEEYVDLLSGSGSVLLGHANPAIAREVREQLELVWNTGAVPTQAGLDAVAAVNAVLEEPYELAVLYSTGMEAAEFALRIARSVTGRAGVVGFEGCMHGKSTATAFLGWPSERVELPDFHRLPYLPRCREDEVLERLRDTLSRNRIGAVFLEPLLGSSGGYVPSREFGAGLSGLCAEHGALLVVDEIFTGFHRTGPRFLHPELGLVPDVLLVGKALGNGFPVSGVVVARRHEITPTMLPGSTYSLNPLAAAAVGATLREMSRLELTSRVAAIEQTVRAGLDGLESMGVALRGKGALWVLELPSPAVVVEVMTELLRNGVVASPTASFIRLLPAATISLDRLDAACRVVREACFARVGARR